MTKRNISSLALSVVLLIILAPLPAGAQEGSGRHEQFCSRQQARQTTMTDKFNKRVSEYEVALDRQIDSMVARRASKEEELATSRAKSDLTRTQSYQALRNRQANGEQRAKAEEFASEIDAAVNIRRSAYDQARVVYRAKLDSLLHDRNEKTREAAANFASSATLVMGATTNSCEDNTADINKVRSDTVKQLRDARLTYAEFLRNRGDFQEAVSGAIESRSEAYKAATAQFQRTMQELHEKYSELR